MKAKESVKNYESTRRMYANYTARSIKKVCKEIGPRFAGSEEEKKSIDYMAEDMKTCCDEVKIDPFTVHPMAFLGWIPLCVVLMVISSVLYFAAQFFEITPLFYASIALPVICTVIVLVEFFAYKELIDKFTPKATSHNVYGIRKPTGETKRRIIFAGHADSSMEWRYTHLGGSKLVIFVAVSSILGIAVSFVLNIFAIVMCVINPEFISSFLLDILSYVMLGYIVFFAPAFFFYDKKRIVEGANDNLSGCFSSIAILKFLQDNDIRFENTEVIALCTGSEEAGTRGAKAFCKQHGKEFSDVETVFIAVDTIRDFDFMRIYSKDLHGMIKNSSEASNLLKEGGKVAGYDLPYKSVALGATDAAAVTNSKSSIKATAFAAMDPTPARYYHTRGDNHENIDLKAIEACVDICLETLFLYDEKGLDV